MKPTSAFNSTMSLLCLLCTSCVVVCIHACMPTSHTEIAPGKNNRAPPICTHGQLAANGRSKLLWHMHMVARASPLLVGVSVLVLASVGMIDWKVAINLLLRNALLVSPFPCRAFLLQVISRGVQVCTVIWCQQAYHAAD